jgi:virulence-associated protein VapD
MYAIAFDIDQERLQRHYPGNSHTYAYEQIRQVFADYGFERQQGSVYFGDARVVSSVTCVLAVQDLVKKHSWFKFVVSDIRMLRIEEDNDLMPAVGDYDLGLDYAKAVME